MKSRVYCALFSLILLAGCQHDPYAHLYNKAAQARPHEPLLIEPGRSVGKIRSGMTMEEVIAAVGEPDRRRTKTLEYLRYGFAVSGSSDGRVLVVFCGGCSRGSPLIKMFAGRTKEGIGMESSRDQIISAFGPPTSSGWEDGEEILRYKSLGLSFFLADSKVHHMTVDFRKRE
ncbi:MAG TPA: hypothetical protein VIW07_10420 [Candidatus Udaeobacter sp.]|jgi:hypothetical protein